MDNKLFMTFHEMEEEIIEKIKGENFNVKELNQYLFSNPKEMDYLYVNENNRVLINYDDVRIKDTYLINLGIMDIQNIYNCVMFNQLPPF